MKASSGPSASPSVAPSPSPPPSACPSCHASVAADARFCPVCGASLGPSPPPPPPPSAPGSASTGPLPPVDIRQRVDEDRGILKRIQLLVPGFRGYRQMEDIRAADALLRLQVADRVHLSLGAVEGIRSSMARENQYQGLTDLATVWTDLNVLEGQIRHAEQGYSGIAPNIQFRQDRLDKLYEYDYGFVAAADQLGTGVSQLQDASNRGDLNALRVSIQAVRSQVQQLSNAFAQRTRAVEGILVG
jgi:hypothetical protein